MVVHKSQPQFRIVTSYGGSNYTFTNDQFLAGKITRVENWFDTATLQLNDYQSANWLVKTDADKTITVELRDASESTWTKVFDGIIRFIRLLGPDEEKIELKCDGKGYGLQETICTHEYGTDSSMATLNTLRLILNTASWGIIDGHVNNMFTNHATDSGFNYTSNNTTCENIAGEIKYLYFPAVPNIKAIQTVCDVVQAIKGANAGPHWIVDVDGNLLVCTVNSDHPDAANNGWYKYYGNSITNATLEQGKDFTEFNFQKMAKEANYILYHGACKCPPSGDYAENNAASWDVSHADLVLSNDNTAGYVKVGDYSLKGTTIRNAGVNLNFFYPKTGFLSLDLSKMMGANISPTFSFYARRNTEINYFSFIIWQDWAGAADWAAPTGSLISYLTVDKWTYFSFDLGNKWMDNAIPMNESAGMNWTDIDRLDFYIGQAANANSKYIWLDGVNFAGTILRGARQAAAYSSTDPMKVKVIKDDIAKGDSLSAADDSGTIARLACAELLRCQTTPIIGSVKVPYIKDLLPGQILHIHAKKVGNTGSCAICGGLGTFRIAKDMRVTQLTHEFNSQTGYTTTIALTDDTVNSFARTSFADVNTILKATFNSDKQTISGRLGELDISQPILEKPY